MIILEQGDDGMYAAPCGRGFEKFLDWRIEHVPTCAVCAKKTELATLAPVPNQPRTPQKTFRIPEDLYQAAQAKAAEKGETLSEVVRRSLERYVKAK